LPSSDYDTGFRDGVMFVTKHIRLAASAVETPQRQDYQNASGKTIRAISRLGSPHLARKYRELADTLENLVTQ
jgi:hypothetical protein